MTPTEERILAAFDALTPAHQRIARVVLDDPVGAALCSAQALGRRAETNAATSVRFAQSLGYSGWSELREALRSEVPGLLTASERLHSAATPTAELDAAVLAAATRNVEETGRANAPAELDAAVRALVDARRVLVVGLGLEASVAEMLAVVLARAGLDVRRLGASAQSTTAVELADVSAQDVVVALGVWRYIADTTRIFEAAVDAGAHGCALVDNRLAPLARRATTTLVAADDSPLLSHSLTGLVALVELIATRVLAATSQASRARLEQIDRIFLRLEVLDD